MCRYTSTWCLYLYIDNQVLCFHISLNEIHNGQTICQISTSAPHQYSVRTIYCIYTFTCRLYLYIDNQICCFHISLNEIHNGQTICQISTSALHQYSVRTIYHIPKTYLKSGYAKLSAKFRQALPTNNLCPLYTTFQNPLWEPAILNQTVMHNCHKHFWNSWICMHAALFLPASSPCIALSKQVSKHTVYGVLLLNYYWCCL